jgi:hypothetical protein
MNYSFFLFSKLFDVHHATDQPYDILFDELKDMYKDWEVWDEENGKNIGGYESMQEYLATHVPN